MKSLIKPASEKRHINGIGRQFQSPLYVVSIGSIVAVNFALAKYVVTIGIPPVDVAIIPMAGAALLLMTLLVMRGQLNRTALVHYRYYLWAGLLGVAIPNLASTYALQSLNTSTFSVLVTLSPIFTLLFTLPFQSSSLTWRKVLGIMVGVIAALSVTLSPQMNTSSPWSALAIALLVPIFLAAGNVYRSRAFPPLANPIVLAAGMLTLQSMIWLPFTHAVDGEFIPNGAGVLALMASLSALSYLLTFRFQRITDGLGFSQVGNVVTVVGVSIGITWYGEPLTLQLIAAVILLLISLYLFNHAKS
ncbi:DMT family transporter [Vibrio lentus]|uniref:DMT family transporter n=1 Tax=Vibrio lentus TaxID=136468 RepID=UPI0024683AB1|nr:DMT family transporter [Vibrio lentus]MDH5925975.1 DMT family transporter [Vibrio lentus]